MHKRMHIHYRDHHLQYVCHIPFNTKFVVSTQLFTNINIMPNFIITLRKVFKKN